jgi:hypothetical protein
MANYKKNKFKGTEILTEAISLSWKFGAVITSIAAILTLVTINFAAAQLVAANSAPILRGLADSFGWVVYILPLTLFAITLVFGLKTYTAYNEQNRF